ncbi:MAG TPA: DUF3347 domain-containing protein [Chitinophagaceae bacterium]
MKRIIFITAITAMAFAQNGFAQDSAAASFAQLLQSYYNIKNALVARNANTASLKAEEFVKTLNGIDPKIINEATRDALLKDAGNISEKKDIKLQRESFATFSINMYTLVKAVKLTTDLVYYAYCPMKKAYWLSSEAAIRNPYYGNMMLTCGKVYETIK